MERMLAKSPHPKYGTSNNEAFLFKGKTSRKRKIVEAKVAIAIIYPKNKLCPRKKTGVKEA